MITQQGLHSISGKNEAINIIQQMQLISFQFDLFIAINATHCLHQLLVLQLPVSTVNRVLPKTADPSSLNSLQKQHQIMVSQVHIFSMPNPLLNFRRQQIALVVAVHDVGSRVSFLGLEKVKHNFLLLQGLFPSRELNTRVSAIFEGVEGFVEVTSFLRNWIIHVPMYHFPLNILIVFKDFDLNRLLSNLVLYAFLLEVVKNGADGFVQTGRDIKKIDLSSDLLNHREFLLHS